MAFEMRFNTDIIDSDFVVDLPVIKCHNQTVVSLGIKNLKGMIDIPSRKRCHNMTPGKDLHFWVSKLADPMPPMFTLLDGIYTNERGPGPDGRLHRSDILVASADVLSADMVGARILGYEPESVPHLVHAAAHRNRSVDFSDVERARRAYRRCGALPSTRFSIQPHRGRYHAGAPGQGGSQGRLLP